jgi:hypothetical protein
MEFRVTNEILPDGKLKDMYYRLEEGEWILGHHQEFVELSPGSEEAQPWFELEARRQHSTEGQ